MIDADGLNALATEKQLVAAAVRRRLVLTPHPGEFARLLGRSLDPALSDDDDARAWRPPPPRPADGARWWCSRAPTPWSPVRTARCCVRKSPRPAWPPPAAATCWPARSAPSWRPAARRSIAAGCGVAVHGTAGLLAEERIGRSGVIAGDIASLLPEASRAAAAERPGVMERPSRASPHRAWVEVDHAALRHNLRALRRLAGTGEAGHRGGQGQRLRPWGDRGQPHAAGGGGGAAGGGDHGRGDRAAPRRA